MEFFQLHEYSGVAALIKIFRILMFPVMNDRKYTSCLTAPGLNGCGIISNIRCLF